MSQRNLIIFDNHRNKVLFIVGNATSIKYRRLHSKSSVIGWYFDVIMALSDDYRVIAPCNYIIFNEIAESSIFGLPNKIIIIWNVDSTDTWPLTINTFIHRKFGRNQAPEIPACLSMHRLHFLRLLYIHRLVSLLCRKMCRKLSSNSLICRNLICARKLQLITLKIISHFNELDFGCVRTQIRYGNYLALA